MLLRTLTVLLALGLQASVLTAAAPTSAPNSYSEVFEYLHRYWGADYSSNVKINFEGTPEAPRVVYFANSDQWEVYCRHYHEDPRITAGMHVKHLVYVVHGRLSPILEASVVAHEIEHKDEQSHDEFVSEADGRLTLVKFFEKILGPDWVRETTDALKTKAAHAELTTGQPYWAVNQGAADVLRLQLQAAGHAVTSGAADMDYLRDASFVLCNAKREILAAYFREIRYNSVPAGH